MGAIGGDNPAWMAAIQRNPLGPVLTHNPPALPMGDGCWVVEGWWCRTGRCLQVCVLMALFLWCHPLPSSSHPHSWLFHPSISPAALTPPWHQHRSHFVSVLSAYILFWLCEGKCRLVCLPCLYHPLITCAALVSCDVAPTPTAFTHIDSGISNQGHRHLGEFNSFQAPYSLNSRSWACAAHQLTALLRRWLSCVWEEDKVSYP